MSDDIPIEKLHEYEVVGNLRDVKIYRRGVLDVLDRDEIDFVIDLLDEDENLYGAKFELEDY